MVDLARGRLAPFGPRAEVRLTDGSPRIEAPAAAFDRFVSTYVLDLLSLEDIAAAFAEAHRVLEPGGLLGLVGLTSAEHGVAQVATWIWEHVHRLRPALVGGCRPIEILSLLPPGDWKVRHRAVAAPYAITSEIVVAERA
jgi:ubiquinone/menaquinone biosynthesis C-methylase UbiE